MRRRPLPRPGVALALRRRPRLRRALVAVVAALSGLSVAATVDGAEDARHRWGRDIGVLLATRDLRPGDRVDEGNTRLARHPAPLVPPGALASVPRGARVAQLVLAGEVVREERLAPAGASALSARLPAGTRAVAIPFEPGITPPAVVGDLVEVLVALPPEVAGTGAPGFALATSVPVVDVSDTAVTIAVDRDVAPRLAVAFGQGAVTLAVVSATERRTAP